MGSTPVSGTLQTLKTTYSLMEDCTMKSIFENENAREAKSKADKVFGCISQIPDDQLTEVLEIIGIVPNPLRENRIRQLVGELMPL